MAILLGATAFSTKSEAQNAMVGNVMDKGVSHASLSLGLMTNTLSPTLSYDYGIVGNLFDEKSSHSIGALFNVFTSSSYRVGDFKARGYGMTIGPRVALHYHFIPKLDAYFSLMVGYQHFSYTVKDGANEHIRSTSGEWAPGYHIGARYAFTPKLAGLLELGYGWAYSNIGLTYIF